MAHIATLGWIHMDLAARNVLVDSGLVYKVSDFGLTRKVDPFTGIYTQTKAMKLPIKWMAGEHAYGNAPTLARSSRIQSSSSAP